MQHAVFCLFVCLFFVGAGEGVGWQILKIIVRVHSFNLHILRISKSLDHFVWFHCSYRLNSAELQQEIN